MTGWWQRGIPEEPCTEDEMSKIAELEAKITDLEAAIQVVLQNRDDTIASLNGQIQALITTAVTDAQLDGVIAKVAAVEASLSLNGAATP